MAMHLAHSFAGRINPYGLLLPDIGPLVNILLGNLPDLVGVLAFLVFVSSSRRLARPFAFLSLSVPHRIPKILLSRLFRVSFPLHHSTRFIEPFTHSISCHLIFIPFARLTFTLLPSSH